MKKAAENMARKGGEVRRARLADLRQLRKKRNLAYGIEVTYVHERLTGKSNLD